MNPPHIPAARPETAPPSRPWRAFAGTAAAVVCAWAVVGLVTSIQVWVAARSMGHASTFSEVAWIWAPIWLFWAALTPVVAALGRRFPLERGRLAARLPVHFLGAVVLGLVHLAFWMTWVQAFSPYRIDAPRSQVAWTYVQMRFNVSFLVYWLVLAAQQTTAYARRLRTREIDGARLESQLAQAQLRALRAQIHPHFLFNTLHATSTLVGSDPMRARRMIARLGDFMRVALEGENAVEVTLRDELATVEIYLDIEQTRFGDRLQVDFDVDPDALDALVPIFILQPLVENAIRHGVARLEGPGAVAISCARESGRLAITIRNHAPGNALAAPRRGVGLTNARERLAQLYGDEQSLVVVAPRPGEVEARMTLPYRSARREAS